MALDDAYRKDLLLAIEENKLLNEWFQHPGFQFFAQRVKDILEVTKNINTVQDERELYKRKGQLDILNWFLAFPGQVKDALEFQIEEAEELVKTVRGWNKDD